MNVEKNGDFLGIIRMKNGMIIMSDQQKTHSQHLNRENRPKHVIRKLMNGINVLTKENYSVLRS
jgi:hypothetical protein